MPCFAPRVMLKRMLPLIVLSAWTLVLAAQAQPTPSSVPPKDPASPPAAKAGTATATPQHEAVGPERCRMCHTIQYTSWAPSKHARATPPVTCETCHGNGKDYTAMAVMKNRELALAAGMVVPGADFCTAKCHPASTFKPDMLERVHAHKTNRTAGS